MSGLEETVREHRVEVARLRRENEALRAAAQQALDFLDNEFGWSPGEAPRIDALRAALAQAKIPGAEPC